MFKDMTVIDITAELLLGIEVDDDECRRTGIDWKRVVPQVTMQS
jgi:hypothetical protein